MHKFRNLLLSSFFKAFVLVTMWYLVYESFFLKLYHLKILLLVLSSLAVYS